MPSPERRAEIVALLVERVTAHPDDLDDPGSSGMAPAAPFFRRVLPTGRCGIGTHDTRIKSPLL